MKRLFVLFAFVLTATFAHAQSTETPTPAAERAHSQAIRMQKQLALTAEQTTQIEAILLARHNEIDAVNADVNKTQEQKDTEIATIRGQKEKEMLAVMTVDQQSRYTEMKAQRAARNGGNASGDE